MSDLRRVVARELAPVVGAGRRALRRHPVWAEAPDGAGVGVVVVPGFGGADASLADLRRWLTRRGYVPAGAGLGLNLGCSTSWPIACSGASRSTRGPPAGRSW